MNIPNLLTIIRILLTPVFVILMLQGRCFFALLIFTIAGLTDALDGLMARLFNQNTPIGKVLDPIADKALLSTAYIITAYLHIIPSWLSVVVISRDIIILAGVLILFIFRSGVDIKPTPLSKWTTFIQLITIFIALLNKNYVILKEPYLLFITAGVITVASGLQYIQKGITIFNS